MKLWTESPETISIEQSESLERLKVGTKFTIRDDYHGGMVDIVIITDVLDSVSQVYTHTDDGAFTTKADHWEFLVKLYADRLT